METQGHRDLSVKICKIIIWAPIIQLQITIVDEHSFRLYPEMLVKTLSYRKHLPKCHLVQMMTASSCLHTVCSLRLLWLVFHDSLTFKLCCLRQKMEKMLKCVCSCVYGGASEASFAFCGKRGMERLTLFLSISF